MTRVRSSSRAYVPLDTHEPCPFERSHDACTHTARLSRSEAAPVQVIACAFACRGAPSPYHTRGVAPGEATPGEVRAEHFWQAVPRRPGAPLRKRMDNIVRVLFQVSGTYTCGIDNANSKPD